MIRRFQCVLFLIFVSLVRGDDKELPIVANARELKKVDSNKIIWQRDGSTMSYIPSSESTKSFWMDTTEVTVGQFKQFLQSAGHKNTKPIDWDLIDECSPTDKHPMVYVNWHDAVAYAVWAGKRLPYENEWEFAARGGLLGKIYPWGNDESLARDYSNFKGVGGKDKWDRQIAPVASLKPNGYGLHDMAGNVWEWCQDWYESDQGIHQYAIGYWKVVRGGSYQLSIFYLPVGNRVLGRCLPIRRFEDNGFRCVVNEQ